MNLDRVPFDRRRFLILGGAAALATACSSTTGSSGSDTTSGTVTPTGAATTNDTGTTDSTTPGDASTGDASTDDASTDDASTDDTGTTDDTTAESTESTESAGGSGDLVRLTGADFDALGTCALMAETTAGPYPTQEHLERSDVTEGYPGHPTRLGLRVVDAACNPVPGAIVEIWHADATGDYSEYSDGGDGKDEGAGTTFLRGYQVAGDDGIVDFHTIYPGWYRGRAVHIHLRVHVDGDTVLTSQLFFDDSYTEEVYAAEPYAANGSPDTPNERDGIAGPAIATGGLLTLSTGPTAGGEGTVALTNLGVAA